MDGLGENFLRTDFSMFGAGQDEINPSGCEARVAKDVGEFDDVVGLVIKGPGGKRKSYSKKE